MTEADHEIRYAEYMNMINMTYSEAVAYLLNKYGPVKDNYFSEKLISVF